MFPSFFAPAGDLFAELDRLSRDMQQLFDGMPVNVGWSATACATPATTAKRP
jgi:hypothetical protein